MDDSNSGPPKQNRDLSQTKIDLGDDLLEKTATLIGEAEREVLPPSENASDLLENAKILQGEGLLEEAKKVLRKVLRLEPGHSVAQKRLGEIHEVELKQIFGSEPTQTRVPVKPPGAMPSSYQLMRDLDRDFSLGIFDSRGEELSPAETIFGSERGMNQFADRLDREHQSSPARDRMDLGIAFLEMGFYLLAFRQFKVASQDESFRVSGTILEAYCQILSGRAFQASLQLEALARESELEDAIKCEIFYLLGRAYEALSKSGDAQSWYRQAFALNAGYRDVKDRITERK